MSQFFSERKFTFTQPDGTTLDVKGWGNQHHAVFETLDGYTVTKDDAGYFCYAKLSPDRSLLLSTGVRAGLVDPAGLGIPKSVRLDPAAATSLARAAATRAGPGRRCEERCRKKQEARRAARFAGPGGPVAAPPSRGTVGEFVGLCLLIDFSDETSTIPRGDVDAFCNEVGYSGFGNNGSVYDYFLENSNSMMEYTNIVTAYYRADHPKTYYTNRNIQQGVRARELIREAIADLDANGFDFSQLTADEEGFVYAVNVFYAGNVTNNWAEGLWPHAWHLGVAVDLGGGRKAFDYQITDLSDELSLGTFCHENGHMVCDYPDLYDYGYQSAGVGAYCLMCAGGNVSEKNPTHIGAYLKHEAGWASELVQITPGLEAQAPIGANKFFIHRKNDTEYFIVENRQKVGRDVALPSSGLAIWHVDHHGDNQHEMMTASMHYECSIEQADGQFTLENNPNRQGDATDLFSLQNGARFADDTSPDARWWDGTASGLELYDIGENAQSMAFKARLFGEGEDATVFTGESSPGTGIPDFDSGGIRDQISINGAAIATALTVRVNITHTYKGDLRVTLISPSGESAVLHDRSGRGTDNIHQTFDVANTPALGNLLGLDVNGLWTLEVQDLARLDHGTLDYWALEITGSGNDGSGTVIEDEVQAGTRIPDTGAIESELALDAGGTIGEIAATVDISHTFIRDLRVTLVSPNGTEAPLHQRTGGSSDNIVKTYTVDDTPSLAGLVDEDIGGTWKLRVSDNEALDTGKLNAWSLRIVRA